MLCKFCSGFMKTLSGDFISLTTIKFTKTALSYKFNIINTDSSEDPIKETVTIGENNFEEEGYNKYELAKMKLALERKMDNARFITHRLMSGFPENL